MDTQIKQYMERGYQKLAYGEPTEAGILFATAAQLDRENASIHLALAETNFALSRRESVLAACAYILSKSQNYENALCRSALSLQSILQGDMTTALKYIDDALEEELQNAYLHALKSYVLRRLGHSYDSRLEHARAVRLSFGGKFEHCFPEEAFPVLRAEDKGVLSQALSPSSASSLSLYSRVYAQLQTVSITFILICVTTFIYLILAILSGNLFTISTSVLVIAGAQVNVLVMQGQYWRIITAIFLHFTISHIGFNMLSLFFVGLPVERYLGKWRFLVLYLCAGIGGGIATYLFASPDTLAAGASGAIFGIFGALGMLLINKRKEMGSRATRAIGEWLFWLSLNIFLGFSLPGIGIVDHIGGLVVGIAAMFLFLPKSIRAH